MKRRIYVASSWRNQYQPTIVGVLRAEGHEVYDFRHPAPRDDGFHWSEIDPAWQDWTTSAYVQALDHPVAVHGFTSDFEAMKWADTIVLLLPCGRSAHLELGWAAGGGKDTAILLRQADFEPELMYRMVDHLAVSLTSLLDWLEELPPPGRQSPRWVCLDEWEIGHCEDPDDREERADRDRGSHAECGFFFLAEAGG